MEMRKCGNSDLQLSALGMGCWAFGGGEYWGDQNQSDVDQTVRRAVELGINYFDSAEAYNDGRSEESLGKAIRELPRDRLVIGTKINPGNAYPEMLVEHCEASLRRLGTDYIDLYMVHWPIHPHSIRHFTNDEAVIENPPDAEEAFAVMANLQQQGKIRHLGVSNFAKPVMEQVLRFGAKVVVNELPYSLLTRAIEGDTLPYCRENGVGVIGYMTLLQGLLADIYPTLSDVPTWQRRTRHFHHTSCDLCRHGEDGAEEETNQALAQIRTIANEAGMAVPEIALKWALVREGITCALVGARNVAELEANVRAASEPLAAEFVEKLNEATQSLMEKLGARFRLLRKRCQQSKQ